MILFCDSFDHYSTLTAKGYTVTGNTSINAGTGRWLKAGRTRSTAVSGNGGSITWNHPSSDDELIIGVAIDADRLGMSHIEFCEGATVHITVWVNNSGNIEIRRGTSGGTLLATGSATVAINTYFYIEVKCKISDTVGAVEVKINGASDVSFSGDTRNGGASGVINNIKLLTPYLGSGVAGANSEWDDLVILDTSGTNNDFLGDVRIEALYPNGNGNSSQLVGSDEDSTDNYAQVDETPPDDDVTYVQSSNVGDRDTYTYSDITSTVGVVYGVQVLPYAKKTDASARSINAVVRSNGVDQVSSDQTLTTSYKYFPYVVEEDPDISAAWTIASVNDAEFGVGVTA